MYPEVWEQLRLGNLIALRNAEPGTAIYEVGSAVLMRTHGSGMSRLFWLLNECKELAMLPVVKDLVIDQCGFGALAKRLQTALCQDTARVAAYTCKHPKQILRDKNGALYWASHERLVGRKVSSGR